MKLLNTEYIKTGIKKKIVEKIEKDSIFSQ